MKLREFLLCHKFMWIFQYFEELIDNHASFKLQTAALLVSPHESTFLPRLFQQIQSALPNKISTMYEIE